MHPKNNTAKQAVQLPPLRQMDFGGPDLAEDHLFQIREDANLVTGLKFAADLSEGLHQITERLAFCIDDGQLVYLSEIRALSFLADAASTLTRSAQYSLEKMGGLE